MKNADGEGIRWRGNLALTRQIDIVSSGLGNGTQNEGAYFCIFVWGIYATSSFSLCVKFRLRWQCSRVQIQSSNVQGHNTTGWKEINPMAVTSCRATAVLRYGCTFWIFQQHRARFVGRYCLPETVCPLVLICANTLLFQAQPNEIEANQCWERQVQEQQQHISFSGIHVSANLFRLCFQRARTDPARHAIVWIWISNICIRGSISCSDLDFIYVINRMCVFP